MVLMTATNLFSVQSYGEFEFWFAGIKVFAIIAFIVLGTLFVLRPVAEQEPGLLQPTAHGGFFPNGVGAIFAGIVVVIFSMVGAEIATIAAAESEDPERAIAKATNSVILRIAIFFVGSVFLLAVILPWDSTELGASPYVTAFERHRHPGRRPHHERRRADRGAVLPQLRAVHRVAHAVRAGRPAGGAGRAITVNSRGVPLVAILSSTVVGFLCVIAATSRPDTVFLFLLNSSGAIILFVYLLICISQLRAAPTNPAGEAQVKMWLYPVLIDSDDRGMVAGADGDGRPAEYPVADLGLSLLAWASCWSYAVQRKTIGEAHLTEPGLAAEARADAWMHEHGPAAELEVDGAVGEGPLRFPSSSAIFARRGTPTRACDTACW